MANTRDVGRDAAIALAYLGGATMAAIGDEYGVSRERVRQILGRQGVTGDTQRATGKPMDAAEFRRRSTSARVLRYGRLERLRAGRAERERHVATLLALAERLGRTPWYGELGAALGKVANPVTKIGRFWHGRAGARVQGYSRRYTLGIHRLYRFCGLALPGPGKRGTRQRCQVEGCAKWNSGGGYCWKHGYRVRLYGDPHRLKAGAVPSITEGAA